MGRGVVLEVSLLMWCLNRTPDAVRAEPSTDQRGSTQTELAAAREKAKERSSLVGSRNSPKASLTFDLPEEDN